MRNQGGILAAGGRRIIDPSGPGHVGVRDGSPVQPGSEPSQGLIPLHHPNLPILAAPKNGPIPANVTGVTCLRSGDGVQWAHKPGEAFVSISQANDDTGCQSAVVFSDLAACALGVHPGHLAFGRHFISSTTRHLHEGGYRRPGALAQSASPSLLVLDPAAPHRASWCPTAVPPACHVPGKSASGRAKKPDGVWHATESLDRGDMDAAPAGGVHGAGRGTEAGP